MEDDADCIRSDWLMRFHGSCISRIEGESPFQKVERLDIIYIISEKYTYGLPCCVA